MRVFMVTQQSESFHPVPAYDFWPQHFRRGLEEVGHVVLEVAGVDWAEGLALEGNALGKWRECTWERTVAHVRHLHLSGGVDLMLCYLFPKQIDTGAVTEIRTLGIPCVNFFCDNVREFQKVPLEFRCFDLHWVPEIKACAMYASAGLTFVHAPMPAWIPVELRSWRHQETFGPTFVGSRDVQREWLFAQALQCGGEIELRGAGWNGDARSSPATGPSRSLSAVVEGQLGLVRRDGFRSWLRRLGGHLRSRVPDTVFREHVRPKPGPDEYPVVLQRSVVALGVNRYPSFRHPFKRPDTYSRLRDIEAPMLGACYLTEWTDGLDQLYQPGIEIEVYSDAEELVGKIEALRRDPRKRHALRQRGQKRALSEHTVGRSVARIAAELGLAG